MTIKPPNLRDFRNAPDSTCPLLSARRKLTALVAVHILMTAQWDFVSLGKLGDKSYLINYVMPPVIYKTETDTLIRVVRFTF